MSGWEIYTGRQAPHDRISTLPPPPPWRTFNGTPLLPVPEELTVRHSAVTYMPAADAIRHVNAALYLRRPLMVTGPPGTGKSTLAYAVAHELKLGPVLHWPITSRVTLRDGLYQYDPLTRLYAARNHSQGADLEASTQGPLTGNPQDADDIGSYIRLGPLGTALLPHERPRVLLIDEIDKSDIDLPNDLLTIFEEGSYEIIELARRAASVAHVMTADGTTSRVPIRNGTVMCNSFPLVVMTSNGEREFPPAFLRRCVSVALKQPETEQELNAIVASHLGGVVSENNGLLPEQAQLIIRHFFERRDSGMLANDQLLNAIYLCHHAVLRDPPGNVLELADQVMPYLDAEPQAQ